MKILTLAEVQSAGVSEHDLMLPPFDPTLPDKHQADGHLVCIAENRIQARCSLWWKNTAQLPGERTGMIGHYSAANALAAEALLRHASETLVRQGCTLAIGPMDGNTWRRYRFVTEAGTAPPFFMEPTNPPEYPVQWTTAGFAPLASYFSAVTEDLATRDVRLDEAAERLHRNGVRFRSLKLDDFEAELERIYTVSVEAFSHNFLYTPLPREAFIAQYRAIRPLVHPELCSIAEHEGKPVGFMFAIPDAAKGDNPDTLILKTQAVLPGRIYAGIGTLLVGKTHEAGARLGYKRIIHALMHESNNALNISSRYAQVFRRYTLFSKKLPSEVIS
ncbi:MAG: GNAT family N-acetyltransferase [Puniceicoccales bacterium]|nr:GNAT family N-acetyltransferase [Puniceicoccales bacterium]